MRNGRVLLLTFAVLALAAIPAGAELCTIDAVPAATLLLPYFEVDLGGSGVDTLFSINNASAEPTVAHVTLWGDWERPTIAFNVFLTGYDVETFSLRDMFVFGNLPISAHATNDDMDLISPHGNNPQWDSAPDNGMATPLFPDCDQSLPIGTNPVLLPKPPFNVDYRARIQRGHTGQSLTGSATDDCAGSNYGDNIARGYITIDNVTDCNLLFPNSFDYFGIGVASQVNQLWGDYFIIDGNAGFAHGDSLVHVEGDPSGNFAAGDYTFYGRFVSGLATDQREPLATTWAARYLSGGAFDGGTDLLVWRESKCGFSGFGPPGYLCQNQPGDFGPPWYPLDETQVVAFDTAEQAAQICTDLPGTPAPGGIAPPPPDIEPTPVQCFKLGTQRVNVGGNPDIDPPFEFGWLYLNLNFTLGDTSGQLDPCATDGLYGDIAQSWVSTNMKAFASQFTVGFAGVQLSQACQTMICSIDQNPCSGDPDCDGGPNSNLDGDTCVNVIPNPIISGDLG